MNELHDFAAKAERFLRSAEQLFALEDYDSCVSRCYYAMFFMAQAALMTKGVTASSHKGVLSLFGKHFVQEGILDARLGRALRRAYDDRITGDYAVGIQVSREEAEVLLREAREFVDQLRKLLRANGAPGT